MPDRHEHVDLDVLQQVEELLAGIEAGTPPPPDGERTPGFATVHTLLARPADAADDDRADLGASHPSAHIPRGATIAEAPVTPLPRRR